MAVKASENASVQVCSCQRHLAYIPFHPSRR